MSHAGNPSNLSQHIREVVRAVFPGLAPDFKLPVASMAERGILYPVRDGLSAQQFHQLSEAAVAASLERTFYLSNWDRLADDRQQDFTIKAFEYATYREYFPPLLEHVIVSPQGRWGVLMCHDLMAIAAGDGIFMSTLYRGLPDLNEQATEYVDGIRSLEIPALEQAAARLLTGLFGEARASSLLNPA